MMKHSLDQKGSALLVVVIILAVGLIGLLGFVFWRAMTMNEPKEQGQEPPSSESLKLVTIPELGISVKYDSTLPDIMYAIETTDLGTQYAKLTNSSLAGTTCTDDIGSIAQVVKNPAEVEDKTHFVSETVFNSDKYYLSLSGSNCTSDEALLSQYQDSLKNHFKDAEQSQQSASSQTEGYLVLQDWKIRFKLPENAGEIKYYKVTPPDAKGFESYYDFTTKRVEELGEKCVGPNDSGYVTRLAGLGRTKEAQQELFGSIPLNNHESIAEYYYYLVGAQSLCATHGEDIQKEDNAMLMEMLKNPIAY